MLGNKLCRHTLRYTNKNIYRTLFGLFGQYNKDKYYNTLDKAVAIKQHDNVPSITGKPRLNELSLKGVAEYMNSSQCQNILILSGAEISAAAGIPDYRKIGGIEARKLMGEHGYDEKKDAENLFSKAHYVPTPYGMFRFVQSLWPGNHRPTLAHYFIRTLQEKGLLLRNWTENIDNLEKVCGIRDDKLVEVNGSFLKWTCLNHKCEQEYDLLWLKERLEMYQFPNCTKCYQKCIPDIIWHEEGATQLFRQASVDAKYCDLIIVLGSDMLLTPFCQIPHYVPWDVPRLVINTNLIENDTDIMATQVLFDFDSDAAYRDVFWEGNTDLGILSLCSYLGWDKDVRYIMDTDTALMPTRREMQERLGLKRPDQEESQLAKVQ